LLKANISSISEGEFRWILLSIAIAIDSKVLVIDYLEKFLDSNRRIILNRVLKRKTSHDGVTIIASSYTPEAFKMSTSVYIKMDNGRITQVRSVSHKSK
jgi:ABC-type cobalamin/Fe3+-siderophores transport system ATPase subunit